jgi:hypothetical protein
MVICTYPKLIAAYHVLHRLPEPRHPPFALILLFSFLLLVKSFYSCFVLKLSEVILYSHTVSFIIQSLISPDYSNKPVCQYVFFTLLSSFQYVKDLSLRSVCHQTFIPEGCPYLQSHL